MGGLRASSQLGRTRNDLRSLALSTLYLVALGAFCVVMLAVMVEAVAGVSRKPAWHAYTFERAEAAPAALPKVAQQAAVERAPLVDVPIAPVEARHSGFAGLTNNEDFQLTA